MTLVSLHYCPETPPRDLINSEVGVKLDYELWGSFLNDSKGQLGERGGEGRKAKKGAETVSAPSPHAEKGGMFDT